MAVNEIVLPVSAMALAAGAIFKAGRADQAIANLKERTDKHEEVLDRSVSRGELDARFAALEMKLDTVLRLLMKPAD